MIYTNYPQYDLELLYKNGCLQYQLDKEYANEVFNICKLQKFNNNPSNQRTGTKNYIGRTEAAWIDRQYPVDFEPYLKNIFNPFNPIITEFYGKKDIDDLKYYVLLAKAEENYEMSWHHDTRRPTVSLFCYFCEEGAKEGGELQIAKAIYDNNLNIVDRKIIQTIMPKNGTILLMDTRSLNFEHRVLKINKLYERYFLYLADIN